MKNKYVLKRHKRITNFFRPLISLYSKIVFDYEYEKYDKDDEPVLVLSNHEHSIDSLLISLSFKMPIYFVINDYFIKNTIPSRLLRYAFNPIPKIKDEKDVRCIRNILRYKEENGSIGIFPSGKIEYTDSNTKIDLTMVKLIRKLNITVVIYNIENLIYRYPRYSYKINKCNTKGTIRKVIHKDELNNYSDTELLDIINQSLTIYDDNKKVNINNNHRAEFLEKTFFICPECNNINSLVSSKNTLKCSLCNMSLEVNSNMNLVKDNNLYKYRRLSDYYNFQIDYIKNNDLSKIEYTDEPVELYKFTEKNKYKKIDKGMLSLKNNTLSLNNHSIDINDIDVISTFLKNKIRILSKNNNYLLVGNKRFNPLKYKLTIEKMKSST